MEQIIGLFLGFLLACFLYWVTQRIREVVEGKVLRAFAGGFITAILLIIAIIIGSSYVL